MSADTGISWYPRSNGLNSLLVSSLITIDSTLYAVAGREVYVAVDHCLHWVIFNNGL